MTVFSRRAIILGGAAWLSAAAGVRAQQDTGLAKRPPARPVLDADGLIARAGLPGRVAYAVMDPDTGAVLDEGSAGAPTPPASILKVVTATYALDRLGAAHRFRTRILDTGDMLVLVGGGDPVLTTDHLAALADRLVATGRQSPQRFAVWGGALPRMSEIAPAQADHVAYNPAISGIILNFNRVHLGWRRQDSGYQMSLEARASSNSPRAYTVTAQPANQNQLFTYQDRNGREEWTVSRQAMGRAGSRWLPVRRPELYAGDVFQTLCRARGLVLPTPEVIETLPAGDEIAVHRSVPLRQILQDMLKYSTNLTAEVVGLHASKARDLRGSARAMQDWLAGQGLGEGFHLADHSGLSAQSRVTALSMVRLLSGPARQAGLEDILKPDPLRETLGKSANGTAEVRAKTGTLNFVSNLAGYANAPDGTTMAFAVLCTDGARHAATLGQDLPAGVIGWTRDAKLLQHGLIESWVARLG